MAQVKDLQIIYRNVDDLIPYARNARTHSEEQITKLASSIKEFGFTDPIELDGENGILSGHGRVMAAKKLGLKQVPCVDLNGLTPAQKKAYILAANRLALDAGWDEDLLKVEFEELKADEFNLEVVGFTEDEIEDCLNPRSYLDDVSEDNFSLIDKDKETDVFAVSFSFPLSMKETVMSYINSVGKDVIQNQIIDEARDYDNRNSSNLDL